ncbi:ABC transporter ATP-binding protein [Candidatus Uabimicrobium sp. HlEnr_7]|uniref:ABC transporter ATP-binding protein n=1 Tax=Candidatus Uabimicrobium helgolandensis TaxID=3095367 RepID=UPI003555E222
MILLKNLTKIFGNFLAVDNLSFEVPSGEIFGFIGPNGAGKTTTIKMLATLLQPDSGNAWIDGHCVYTDPEKVRMAMGYMPDYFGTYDNVTIFEFLDFFARSYRIPPKNRTGTIKGCMELTDLQKLESKLVSSLSKGMKQRLCLAKTLLHNPNVLILDEPAAGLDPRARIEFRSLLRELRNMNKTVFISSHILTELSDIVDSVAIVEKGGLVVSGNLQTISQLSSKNHTEVRIKIHSKEKIETALNVLENTDEIINVHNENDSILIEYSGQTENLYLVIKNLVNADIPITEVTSSQSNLEDIFMRVTQGEVS